MDLTNSIANALSGVRLAPSEAEQSAILRALIEKQANRQQQMGYTGGTPAQQAAGLEIGRAHV